MSSDPLHVLQAAARAYGRHVVPGYCGGRLKLCDDTGRKVAEVMVPPAADREESLAPEARPGWDFSRRSPRFDGVEFPQIAGRNRSVLEVLANADGPVNVEGLRAAWTDYQASDSTIRNQVSELRKLLRKLWPDWEGEPISSCGNGYSLEIR